MDYWVSNCNHERPACGCSQPTTEAACGYGDSVSSPRNSANPAVKLEPRSNRSRRSSHDDLLDFDFPEAPGMFV